jgi:tetratricopeptide (TPR) repeat protein
MNALASSNTKISRNDPCPCGSGKKYKACCLQAEARFRSRQGPDFAGSLGRARQAVAHGDFEGAEFWFRQTVAARPANAEALAGLGQSLCWLRRKREGVGYLCKAAQRLLKTAGRGGAARPLVDLAVQLQHWGEADTALRLVHRAVALAPLEAFAHQGLAMCLSRLNLVEEALEASRRAQRLSPDDPNVNILLALLEQRCGNLVAAKHRLDGVIIRDGEAEVISRAYLEMAHVLDKLGDYEAAFEAVSRARCMESRSPAAAAIDRNIVPGRVAANSAGFTEAFLRQRADTFAPDGLPTPVFLMGFLRSGTTLTEQVLGAHPGVFAADECDLVFELGQELSRRAGTSGDLAAQLCRTGPEGVAQLRRHYWRRVEEEYGASVRHKVFVNKNALNTIDIGLINYLFPEAKVIFALRDPRDVVLSCFMQSFGLAPATVHMLSWEGAARLYSDVMGLWLDIRKRLTLHYLEIRYEDAVEDFRDQYHRLFRLLGLEWHPDVAHFYEKNGRKVISTPSFAEVTKPVYKTAAGRWRNYERHFQSVMVHLDRFVDAFGYR